MGSSLIELRGMKKAVITTGGKQYIVSEGETITVDVLQGDSKTATFSPLMVIDGNKITVGQPEVEGVKVTADILAEQNTSIKTTSIRYKAKKRVKTVRGHRQHFTDLKITKIA